MSEAEEITTPRGVIVRLEPDGSIRVVGYSSRPPPPPEVEEDE